MVALLLIFIAVESYLLGGINGSIIASKYIFRRDIRNFGSRNAGLTNFYRTFGARGAVLVLAIDVLKTVIAVSAGGLMLGYIDEPIVNAAMLGKLFSGFCVILGHSFPVYYDFKGGKGVLCGLVMIFLVDWRVAIVCLLAFLVVLILTRYVSLSSMVGAVLLPLGLWIGQHGGLEGTLGLFTSLLIIFKHSENIGRLLSGRETRFDIAGKPKQRFDE